MNLHKRAHYYDDDDDNNKMVNVVLSTNDTNERWLCDGVDGDRAGQCVCDATYVRSMHFVSLLF